MQFGIFAEDFGHFSLTIELIVWVGFFFNPERPTLNFLESNIQLSKITIFFQYTQFIYPNSSFHPFHCWETFCSEANLVLMVGLTTVSIVDQYSS